MWGWTGTILVWVAAMALLLAAPRLTRLELATIAAVGGYVAWVALSRLWSEAPGHTLSEVQRDLMYPLALLVALVLLRRSAVRACVTAVADAIDALALYGLVARLFPERLAAVIQTVMFHTSCSQLIAVGDEFGALEITAGTNVPK